MNAGESPEPGGYADRGVLLTCIKRLLTVFLLSVLPGNAPPRSGSPLPTAFSWRGLSTPYCTRPGIPLERLGCYDFFRDMSVIWVMAKSKRTSMLLPSRLVEHNERALHRAEWPTDS